MSISFAEASALRKAVQQGTRTRNVQHLRSTTSDLSHNNVPRPKSMPEPTTYERVARPGAYYERPRLKRDLPTVQPPWLSLGIFSLLGIAGWWVFIEYSTNQERLASSVVRQVMLNLRESDAVRECLGEGARPEPTWYLNGDPWVNGTINMLQGTVDFSLRVKGSQGAGTLYFTSIRREKGHPFEILRYKIICDNGKEINLPIRITRS